MNSFLYFWSAILTILFGIYFFTDFGVPVEDRNVPANVYALLTPIAIGLVLLEILYTWVTRKKLISFQEGIINFGTAIANQTTNVLVFAGVTILYGFLWENFRLIESIEMNIWTGIILLLAIDFIFYWIHRWGHHVNIMWAAHSPHHSAEEMNLLVGLRASVTQRLMSFFFFWPLTLIGFAPTDIYVMTGLHLFLGFWHHTEVLPKFWRWIEYVFNTPSHHRVHHGVNFQYLDKNFSEFLIVWDRLFGTFEEEDEKVIYGMYNGPQSWNLININFHYYIILWKTAMAAPHFWDKIKIWFMPLTWVPRGMEDKEALYEITLENQVKYRAKPFQKVNLYIVFQLMIGVVGMLFVIKANSPWTGFERWIGALLLWHMIINWGGMLESKKWTAISEFIRLFCMGAAFILFNDWYNDPMYMSIVLSLTTIFMVWTWMYFRHSSDATGDLETGANTNPVAALAA